jgi:hypothetical protein
MSKLLMAIIAALTLIAAPALAQTDADVDARIDMVLGDHAAYREAFDAIQAAVAAKDGAAFAAWVSYPITVVADGEEMVIGSTEQFAEHFDTIVTDEIATAITGQKWADLFVNDQGLMFGNGQVWVNGICKDETCATFDVKVITIQSTSN